MEDKEAKPFKEIKPGDTVYCFDLTDNSLTKFKVRKCGYDEFDFFKIIFDDTYSEIGESDDYYDFFKPVFVQGESLFSTSINAIHEYLTNAVKALAETTPVIPKRTGYGYIDDQGSLSLWMSYCTKCKFYDDITCKAFPKGIPRVYLNGDDKHTKIDYDQEGDYVFTPKE